MSNKKKFVLRIDIQTYEAIEKWAADEFRSVNGQLEWIIAESLKKAGRLKKSAPRGATKQTLKKHKGYG